MAYNDLSLQERAQVIKMGVQAGLKSLDDIRSLYDTAANEYAEGGGIHIKHPGRLTALKERTGKTEAELWATGNAHTRKMITFARNARKWKHADGGIMDGVRRRLARNINPYTYDNPISRVFNAVVLNKPEEARSRHEGIMQGGDIDSTGRTYRLAAWSKYLNSPIEGIDTDAMIVPSQYAPSQSANPSAKYYTYKAAEGGDVFDAYRATSGNFTLGSGKDDRGEYYSLYDLWDLDAFGTGKDNSMGIGQPFEVYDRVYLNESPEQYSKIEQYYKYALEEQGKKPGDNVVLSYALGGPLLTTPKRGATSSHKYSTGGIMYPFSFSKGPKPSVLH